HLQSLPYTQNFRTAIGFMLFSEGSQAHQAVWLELGSSRGKHIHIKVVDSQGTVMFQERQRIKDLGPKLTFSLRNLASGTYYFEVNDGFYYQIKELVV
ncbi:MAG: hypothetical protein AAF804_17425, partial [Bacteroidota bacterium]